MRAQEPLLIGQVIKRYDHGYIVIWDYDNDRGLETTDDAYHRIVDQCPAPSRLLGTLTLYRPNVDGRSIDWFTAFSKEQLDLLIDTERRHSPNLSRSEAVLKGLDRTLSAAIRKALRERSHPTDWVEVFDEATLEISQSGNPAFEAFWESRITHIERYLSGVRQ